MDLEREHVKIPLPDFLKLLTSNNVSIPKAMAIAGKVFVLIHSNRFQSSSFNA